jgi:hypothetical protein
MDQSFEDFTEERMAIYRESSEEKGKEFHEEAAAKKIAKEYLREFVADDDNLEIVAPIKEALTKLFKTVRAISAPGSRATAKNIIRRKIKDMIVEAGAINESDVFMTSMGLGSSWGRAEMKDFIKSCIRTAPEDRVWIELENKPDEPMGSYVVIGTGPDAPEGWEGFMPVEEVVEL